MSEAPKLRPPRFGKAELDQRADIMRQIGYPQHQIEAQLRLMRAGIYTPLDRLPMFEPAQEKGR